MTLYNTSLGQATQSHEAVMATDLRSYERKRQKEKEKKKERDRYNRVFELHVYRSL